MAQVTRVFLVPPRDLSWRVSLDGQLHVAWLRKISQFAETNKVEISWRTDDGESGSSTGTVLSSTIPSLVLGKTYKASLMDLREEGGLATFKFTACELFIRILLELPTIFNQLFYWFWLYSLLSGYLLIGFTSSLTTHIFITTTHLREIFLYHPSFTFSNIVQFSLCSLLIHFKVHIDIIMIKSITHF